MKRKIISTVLAIVMVLTLAPVALAQEEAGPYVTNFEFVINGTAYHEEDGVCRIPGDTVIDTLDVTITFDKEVKFVQSAYLDENGYPTSSIPTWALYVKNVTDQNVSINLNAIFGEFDLNDRGFSIVLTTEDNGITWKGGVPLTAFISFLDLNMFTLAANLHNPFQIMADSVEYADDTGAKNQTNYLIFNRDDTNINIFQSGYVDAIYTVTYVCYSQTFVWKLPAGISLTFPQPPKYDTVSFVGWYTDKAMTQVVPADTIVDQNMTVYAKYEDTTGETFSAQLANQGLDKVYIDSVEDFDIFAQQASVVQPGRWVILNYDLDLSEKTYTAIQYNANFDGNGKTISNATFTPNGDNSGMFAELGKGTKIVNLTLENITVENAQNAGTVAGSITSGSGDASQTDRPLIQNVYVSNSKITGRNAGGIVGFTFLSDIQYCSVKNTTVAGLVNAGGIAAQSYSNTSNCITVGLTLGQYFFTYSGGIVATMLEACKVDFCITTEKSVYGRHNDGELGTNITSITNQTPASVAVQAGFNRTYWNLTNPLTNSSFTNAAKYDIPTSAN